MRRPWAAALAACALASVAAVPAVVVASHLDRRAPGHARAGADRRPRRPVPSAGHDIFIGAGCGDCHTLAAAGAHGRVGPNLGRLLAGLPRGRVRRVVEHQVRHGGGGMPPFRGLSDAQVDALARYLARITAHPGS